MAKQLKTYHYKPTNTHVTLYDDDIAIIRFGMFTTDLEQNTKETQWVKKVYLELIEIKNPLYILMDFSKVDSAEYNSDESNQIYLEMLRSKHIVKVGMFGLDSGWGLFINLFRFYVKNKISTFETESEAREWLNRVKST